MALAVLVVATGVVASYTARFQATTLWAGKKLAGKELSEQMPRGFQDAITPESQNRRNMLNFALYVAIMVLGSIQAWYAGVIAIIATLVASAIADRFIPNDLEYYLIRVAWALDNREADYRKQNDLMRADATHQMADSIKGLIEEVHSTGDKVPPIRKAKRMYRAGEYESRNGSCP